jgi:ubiquinone/menaquinone biosynthesis C-methylase UbiE
MMDFDRVAAAWSRWWPHFERGAGVISQRMVDLASIEPGDVVLDVATGLGEPALLAAKRVGPSGRVIGIDISPSMLALARERAREEMLVNATFIEGDASTFLAPTAFDAILSRWGLMFLADLPAALAHMRERLKEGGRFVAAVWGSPADVPLISLATRIAGQQFGTEAPPLAGGPFALHDPAALAKQFLDSGFADANTEEVAVVFPFDSAKQYFDHISEVAPPIVMLMNRLSEGQRAQLRAAVEESVAAKFSADNEIRIPNSAFIVSASR